VKTALGGLILLAACATTEAIPVETVYVGGQALTWRYTPTGDVVPHMGVGVMYVNEDGIIVQEPDRTVYDTASYPTVRIGGSQDEFVALTAFFERCLPGQTFDRADYGDEVFTLDARTDEWVFTYPCPPLESVSPDA
jgi:hypothetical protein